MTVDASLPVFIDEASFASVEGAQAVVNVFLTSKSGACGWLDQTNASRGDLTTIAMYVRSTGEPSGQAIAPGTYPVGGSFDPDSGVQQTVQVSLLATDADCGSTLDEMSGQNGSITLTSITPQAVAGSFDVTFYSGDHLTGTFNAPQCASVAIGNEAGACHP